MMSTESHTTFGGPVYLDDWDAPQQERAFLSPPTLPSPQTARDIHWGGDLTGRTVSGHSVMPQFSDDDHQRLSHKSSLSTLREASEAEYSELSDDELQPPTALGRVDTPGSYGSHESFHTADGAGATSSDSDRGGATTPRQSLYNAPRQASPAPASPSLSHGNLKVAIPESAVPDRFRPRIVSEADSLASVDSMMSSTSTNLTNMTHESVLPSVAARVAQMESREKALRKFSVASSAGLVSSPPTHLVPLSPTSSGRVSPSGRKSYTSALGGPRPRSPMSPMSLHSNTMTIHSNTVSERSVSPASFDHSPVPTTTSLPSVDEHGTTQSAVSDGARKPYGLDAAALGGTAFARGITSPNSSLGHGHNRWSMGSVLSQDAHRMLNRALSTSSNSTTATDVDRALSPTRMGPRGPRAATRTVISPISTAPSLSAVVNKMPIMSAVTPTQQLNLNPLFRSVKSESAEFEDGEGYMSDTYSDIEGHEIVILSSNAQGLQPQVNSVRSMQTPALCKSGSMTSSDESEPKSAKSVYGRLQTLTTFSKIDSDKFDNIETASNSGSAESASTAPSATSNWSTGLKGVMNMNVRLPQFSMR
jgi:hypothetical protein